MIIANRRISLSDEPLIIAEIGINHGGDINIAKKMVDSAASVGCEMIKHQTHFVEDEMTSEAKKIFPPNANISIWDVIEKCSLSEEEELELKHYTEKKDIIYISTPFSRKAADFLNEIDVPAFKIGSGEVDNLPLIEHIANFGKPIIMSTGMQSIQSIFDSVEILRNSKVDFALLECTNAYPSSPEFVSLKGISELREAFPNTPIGFSDHSIGPEMALSAIALGSCIIERHFTDDRYRNGPDIRCSMDANELKFLINRGKEIHLAINNSKFRTEPEEHVYKFARSSVVADRKLTKGTILDNRDIWVRRPGTGPIAAYDYYKVLGRKLKNDKNFNDTINWEDLE